MEALLKFLDSLINSYGVSGTWLTACLGIASTGVLLFYIIKTTMLLHSHFKAPVDMALKSDLVVIKTALQDDNKYILKLLEGVDDRLKREVYDRLANVEQATDHLMEMSRQLEAELSKVNSITEHIKSIQDEDLKTSTTILHDVDVLVQDTKDQHNELARRVQDLQVDLAALHGTLIGLNTQRSRLK